MSYYIYHTCVYICVYTHASLVEAIIAVDLFNVSVSIRRHVCQRFIYSDGI